MRFSYSVAIMSFAGAERAGYLIQTINNLPIVHLMDRLIVVEDLCPVLEKHDEYLSMIGRFPGWELVSKKEWGNAQGTAQEAIKQCDSDFIFLLEDDQLAVGDPFSDIISFLDNCSPELADITGAVQLSHFQATTDLKDAGMFPPFEFGGRYIIEDGVRRPNPKNVINVFYNDPLNTWFKGIKKLEDKNLPSLGMNAHGQGSLISKKAWVMCGGYDSRWHAFDQVLSYRIWMNTPYIIYSFPTDPFYHCGACAQCGDYYSHDVGASQGSEERCVEIFGMLPKDIETKILTPLINYRAVPYWQLKLLRDYEEWKLKIRS